MNKTRRAYYQRKGFATHLLKTYGITEADYDALIVAQGGKCAICQTSNPMVRSGADARWHVDHDHDTGKVRGLLCFRCNSGLGHFDDDQTRLKQAIEYLAKNKFFVSYKSAEARLHVWDPENTLVRKVE